MMLKWNFTEILQWFRVPDFFATLYIDIFFARYDVEEENEVKHATMEFSCSEKYFCFIIWKNMKLNNVFHLLVIFRKTYLHVKR